MKLRLCSLLFTHCVACYVCRLVEVYIRLSSNFWVSRCKAVFALACFHNAFPQFLSLRGVLTLVSCLIVLANLQVYFSLLERVVWECLTSVFFHRCCCSGRWLFWNYDLFLESALKMDITSLWKEKAFLIAKVWKTFQTKFWEVGFNPHRLMWASQTRLLILPVQFRPGYLQFTIIHMLGDTPIQQKL